MRGDPRIAARLQPATRLDLRSLGAGGDDAAGSAAPNARKAAHVRGVASGSLLQRERGFGGSKCTYYSGASGGG